MHIDSELLLTNTSFNQASPHRLCILNDWGLIKVCGQDAQKFLQGQLTCNVDAAMPSTLGAMCNPKGRMVSLFHLFVMKEAYYLCMLREMVVPTLKALKKYAIFFKVTCSDASNDFIVMGCTDGAFRHEDALRIPVPTKSSRSLLITDTLKAPAVWTALAPHMQLASSSYWDLLNIQDKLPILHPDLAEMFLPQEWGIENNAIDFGKGCYTGQEIIARIHYRGKVKNRLYHATVTSNQTLVPAERLYTYQDQTPQESGWVINTVLANDNITHALIVTDESHAKNQHLFQHADPTVFFNLNLENI